jgi:hypothetical protein
VRRQKKREERKTRKQVFFTDKEENTVSLGRAEKVGCLLCLHYQAPSLLHMESSVSESGEDKGRREREREGIMKRNVLQKKLAKWPFSLSWTWSLQKVFGWTYLPIIR